MYNSKLDEKRKAALAVPLKRILEEEGITPLPGRGGCWYKSPFREEKNGSFKINLNNNTWVDYGLTGTHLTGDTINLIERLKGFNFIESVEYILSRYGYGCMPPESIHETVYTSKNAKVTPSAAPAHRIEKVCELTNPQLVQYIESRCIDIDVARVYCREVHYVHLKSGKRFVGIGFPNDSQGWVIRTPPDDMNANGDKLDIISKGISTIRINASQAGISCYVFEGFFNFLAWIMFYGEPDKDVIVLNSSSNKKYLDNIADKGVRNLLVYADNDESGRCVLKHLREHSGCSVYDNSFYVRDGINDLNDYLKAHPTHT